MRMRARRKGAMELSLVGLFYCTRGHATTPNRIASKILRKRTSELHGRDRAHRGPSGRTCGGVGGTTLVQTLPPESGSVNNLHRRDPQGGTMGSSTLRIHGKLFDADVGR